MTWVDFSGVVLMGLAGSGHCVGMCGGFVLAVGKGAGGAGALFVRHAAYQAGKALTYVFLAALVSAGFGLLGGAGWFARGQMVLSIAAGVVMVGFGLGQLFEWRAGGWWQKLAEPLPACRSLAAVANTPGPLAAFVTGWLNGFIPCGLVVAMIMNVAAWHSVGAAALGAAAFGAATFPGLFAFGLVAHAWTPRWRRVLVRVSGVLLILFGALTIVRAFPEGRQWIKRMRGMETAPAMQQTGADACCH
jgi:uncharacterized protein